MQSHHLMHYKHSYLSRIHNHNNGTSTQSEFISDIKKIAKCQSMSISQSQKTKLHKISGACCLWLWPPLTAVRKMDFQFYG